MNTSGSLFIIPETAGELLSCIFVFIAVIGAIYMSERFTLKYHTHSEHSIRERVLYWELGTIAAIVAGYLSGERCVILPLSFLLALLVMWYLTRTLRILSGKGR
jgi:small-conductance mechanosensitive channel